MWRGKEERTSGPEGRMIFAGFMYGLKPVPWSFYISKARRLPVPLQCYACDWIRTGFVSGHGFQPCRNTTERNRALAPGMANPKRNASGDRILSPSRTFFVTTKTIARAMCAIRNILLRIPLGKD